MTHYDPPLFVTIAVTSDAQLRAVYALLGGASVAGLSAGNVAAASTVDLAALAPAPTAAVPTPAAEQSGSAAGASPAVSDETVEVDAHGHPWSADLHAATKTQTKDGLWRMKVGVTRPAPKPGFPKATGTEASGTAPSPSTSAISPAATAAAPAPSVTEDEDDEFAAFRAAAAKADAADAAAQASIPARKWTDADLGALCNQAAVKLGDPAPIKAIIADFVPEGVVAHSRNIPEASRADFAKAIEAKAGIEFAG